MKSANRPTFDSLATLTIDPEFQARCGKLQDHELELLRQQRAGEYVRGLNKIEAEHGPEARAGAKRTKTRQEVRDIGKDKVDSEPPTEPQPLTDEAGNVVPEPLRHVFEALREFDDLQRQHDAIRHRVEALAKTEAGKLIHMVSYAANIKNAKSDLKFGRPHALCPYPHKKAGACEACHGLGWVSKFVYDSAPKEW